jgi:hypothetical protein
VAGRRCWIEAASRRPRGVRAGTATTATVSSADAASRRRNNHSTGRWLRMPAISRAVPSATTAAGTTAAHWRRAATSPSTSNPRAVSPSWTAVISGDATTAATFAP